MPHACTVPSPPPATRATGHSSSTAPGLLSLPVELLSLVFECLRDDSSKLHLIACSKVSKTWRRYSVGLLFAELSLGFYDEVGMAAMPADGQINRPYYSTLSVFLAFLKSVPHIASCIRSLTLICREYEVEEYDSEYYHYVDHTTLLSILQQLPRLHTVKLRDVMLRGSTRTLAATAQDPGYTPLIVDEVRLDYTVLSGDPKVELCMDVVLAPLHLFGGVNTLCLQNVMIEEGRAAAISPQLRVQRLVLEEVDTFGLLIDSLQSTQILQDIRALDAGYLSRGDLMSFRSLLDDVGGSLTQLSCAFASEHFHLKGNMITQDIDPETDLLFGMLDLSCCCNLSALDFQLMLFKNTTWDNEIRNIRQWLCAIRMLSYLGPDANAPTLTISFSIDSTPLGDGIVAEHLLGLRNTMNDAERELIRLAEVKRPIQVKVSVRRWGAYIYDDYAIHVFPVLRSIGVLVV